MVLDLFLDNPGPGRALWVSAKDPGAVHAFGSLRLRKINLHGVYTLGLWDSSKIKITWAVTVPLCWVLKIENLNGIVLGLSVFGTVLKSEGLSQAFWSQPKPHKFLNLPGPFMVDNYNKMPKFSGFWVFDHTN